MRKTLVLLFWLVATIGVTYVANAAVQLVDRQVLPEDSQIQVLSFPETTEETSLNEASPTPVITTVEPSIIEVFESQENEIIPETTTSLLATTTTTSVIEQELEVEPEIIPETSFETGSESEDQENIEVGSEESVIQTTTTTITENPVSTTTSVPVTTTMPDFPALIFLTQELPKAKMGTNYDFQLRAEGGSPPYEWSVISGTLPKNLQITKKGQISGVLNEGGENSFVVEIEDRNQKTSISSELSIEIEPNRKTVIARGGTAFIDIDGDLVSLFLVSPADGYSAIIVEPGGFRVEVQFVPIQGDSTSYVICEVNQEVICSSD